MKTLFIPMLFALAVCMYSIPQIGGGMAAAGDNPDVRNFGTKRVVGIYVKPSGNAKFDKMFSSAAGLDFISKGYRVKDLNALLREHAEKTVRWNGASGTARTLLGMAYMLPLDAIVIGQPEWDSVLVITRIQERTTTDWHLTSFSGFKSVRLECKVNAFDASTEKEILDFEGEDTCRLYSLQKSDVANFAEHPWVPAARQVATAFKDIPVCAFEDTSTATYRFPLFLYVDKAYRDKFPTQWSERLQRRVLYASDILRKQFDIELVLVGVNEWNSTFSSSLPWMLNTFRASIPERLPAIRIGVTVDPELKSYWSRRSMIGVAFPLTTIATISAQPSFPGVTDWNSLEEALTLAHEIGHLLGAAHSTDASSIMYPTSGSLSYEFDPCNRQIINNMKLNFFAMDEEHRFMQYGRVLSEIHSGELRNAANILYPLTQAVGHTQFLTIRESYEMPDSTRLYAVMEKMVPDSVLRIAVRGYSEYRRGHLESAERFLLRAVEIEPDFGEAHMCLSEIERKLGKSSEAASHLKSANQLGIYESIDD